MNSYGNTIWWLVYYIPMPHPPKIPPRNLIELLQTRTPYNSFTSYLLHFKHGYYDIMDKWCEWVRDEFSNFKPHIDYIIRALESKETIPLELPMDRIGRTIAQATHSQYIPDILIKQRTHNPRYGFNKLARSKEIENIYNFDLSKNIDLNNKTVLIIDDVCTTGSTLSEIEKTILRTFPDAKLIYFTLGNTTNRENLDANKDVTRKYFPDAIQ